MLKRLWLFFAQTVVFLLAILFVTSLFSNKSQHYLNHLSALITGETQQQQNYARLQNNSFAYAANKAMPAVVNVFADKSFHSADAIPIKDQPSDRLKKKHSTNQEDIHLASGVIVSQDGYIITNQHVIENAKDIEVTLNNGQTIEAKVVGSDPETDLAVLKINFQKLPFLNFANSNEVQVGNIVLAIGNPFGVGQTTTMGIVSALGRNHLGINTFENYIQTDAAINPGNSGGALIDVNGQLVGINTAIYSRGGGSLGIGFAIPSSAVKSILNSIIETGTVTRGWIGVMLQDLPFDSEEQSSNSHPIILKVIDNSPADKAGIKKGDKVIALNDKPIHDPITLLNAIAAIKPNTPITLQIADNGTIKTIRLTVGKRPSSLKNTH